MNDQDSFPSFFLHHKVEDVFVYWRLLCTSGFYETCFLSIFFFFFNFLLLHVPYASFISIIILFYSLLLVSYCFVFRWISLGSSPISPTCPGCRLSFIVSWIRDALWCSLIHGAALLIFSSFFFSLLIFISSKMVFLLYYVSILLLVLFFGGLGLLLWSDIKPRL